MPPALTPGVSSEAASVTPGVEFAEGMASIIDKAASNGKLKFYTRGVDVRRAISELLVSASYTHTHPLSYTRSLTPNHSPPLTRSPPPAHPPGE